jgi:hypothetical protein
LIHVCRSAQSAASRPTRLTAQVQKDEQSEARAWSVCRTVEAPSSVLDARLELYSVNFGDASRHLEDARAQLRRAEEQLKSLGRQDDVARLEPALTRIDEAQRLAGQLDQSANARAAEAAKIIDDVLGTEGKGKRANSRSN